MSCHIDMLSIEGFSPTFLYFTGARGHNRYPRNHLTFWGVWVRISIQAHQLAGFFSRQYLQPPNNEFGLRIHISGYLRSTRKRNG